MKQVRLDHEWVKGQVQDGPVDRAVDYEMKCPRRSVANLEKEIRANRGGILAGACLFGVSTAIPGFRIRLPHLSFGHNSEYLLVLDSSASSACSLKEDADRCCGHCFLERPPNRA